MIQTIFKSKTTMNLFQFSSLPSEVVVKGKFDETCTLELHNQTLSAIQKSKLKLIMRTHGSNQTISGLKISIASISGNINISVGHHNASVIFYEQSSGRYDLRLWRNSSVVIGKSTTSNGVRIVCDNSSFQCGEDCMFSDEIVIQSADQHGIVDLEKGEIINDILKSVVLGDHVWLGRQATLMADSSVGSGSIIGTGAVVTGNIPEKVIAVGIPARVVKENRTWCRSPIKLDHFSERYIQDHLR